MPSNLHVLHVAAECAPFAKVGGLADVVGALPRWSRRVAGIEASVVLPWYEHLGGAGRELVLRGSVRVMGRDRDWTAWRAAPGLADFPLFLVEHEVFREGGIYGGDALVRQAILGSAAQGLALASRDPRSHLPVVDVVHAHDHHAAFAALWLRYREDPGPPVMATVHNARYHGAHDWASVEGLVPHAAPRGDVDHDGRFDSLKAAVLSAALVTTVSGAHAAELASRPDSSLGLDYAFRGIGGRLVGILNGIDTDAWDPATDEALPAPFSADDPSGKSASKRALCETHGLDASKPLLAFVGRLVSEKGVDVLADAVPLLAEREKDAQLLVLGIGERGYEERIARLEASYPGRVRAALRHDEALAHLVYAGADVLLMPSWHEPCGLSQMYALRYGTVPVVHPTGGLRDSVVPFDETTGKGTGAWMARCDAPALADAVSRVLGWWRRDATWRIIRANGMRADLSWAASAGRYVDCYRTLVMQGGRP